MGAIIIARLLLVVGVSLLLAGADWLRDGARDLARPLGVSALVLGGFLAGLEPDEMLTAAIASARGAPDRALGNVVGTNMTIITVALGLSALLCPMILAQSVRRQAAIATLASVVPIVLLFLGAVTPAEGILLRLVFCGYTFMLIRTDREAIKRFTKQADDDQTPQKAPGRPRSRWKPIVLTVQRPGGSGRRRSGHRRRRMAPHSGGRTESVSSRGNHRLPGHRSRNDRPGKKRGSPKTG